MAQTSKHRKYRRQAVSQRQRLKGMLKKHGMNILHRFYIVEAEFSATFSGRKSFVTVRKEFDLAISTCRRSGYIHDAALANELAGRYAESSRSSFWAKHYYSCAYNLYEAWGAHGKSANLVAEHGEFLPPENTILDSLSLQNSRDDLVQRSMEIHSNVNLGVVSNPHGTSTGDGSIHIFVAS